METYISMKRCCQSISKERRKENIMIIDAHTHISDSEYGNIEIYEKESKAAGIDKSILFPGGSIDVRKMSRYILMKEVPPKIPVNNDLIYRLIEANPNKYKAFVGINPLEKELQETLDEFENYIKNKGFVGLKLSPTSHRFSFFDKNVQALMDLAGDLEVPVYAHTSMGEGISTDSYAECAKMHPKTNFIIGHMGFGASDIDALYHAKDNENLYLETSGGSSIIIKQAFNIVGDEKLIFGSEYPLHSIKSEKVKIEELDQYGDLDNVFYKNIVRLLKL